MIIAGFFFCHSCIHTVCISWIMFFQHRNDVVVHVERIIPIACIIKFVSFKKKTVQSVQQNLPKLQDLNQKTKLWYTLYLLPLHKCFIPFKAKKSSCSMARKSALQPSSAQRIYQAKATTEAEHKREFKSRYATFSVLLLHYLGKE